MRIATYNIEWFNALFDDDDQLRADDGWSARYNITRAAQAEAVAKVLIALNADALMIVEAPDANLRRDAVRALEGFAAAFGLRQSRAAIGYVNDTQQEIVLLYDPSRIEATHDPRQSATAPRFDGKFHIDLDIDANRDVVQFSKPPLELAVTTAGGRRLRLIGTHLKSKAPHGARGRDAVMRMAIANRRKQLAQAIWLRGRIDDHLADGDSLIVLGDLNDGPGLDEYENLFGRSSVEIILGGEGDGPFLFDPHARQALQRRIAAAPTSARFFIAAQDRWLEALLDYVMLSPDLVRDTAPRWRIWHPFNDPACYEDPELRAALLTASDHFPVSVDLSL